MSFIEKHYRVKQQGKRTLACLVLFLAALIVASVLPVYAGLERVGPVNPSNGYPAWYQDNSGLIMEFCSPLNQAELSGGWCLLLPPDVPGGAPEVFPTNFAEEHFYWAANTTINFNLPNGVPSRALLVLGLEGAFAQGPVVQGDQITFGRIRVRINDLPFSGTYTVYHPYGVWTFPDQVAGTRLFFTEDIGINCPPGQFSCALASNLGPFLLPSTIPGGAELPPVMGPVAGKLYIADPARIGPVTGSPLPDFTSTLLNGATRDHNIFRVEGPNGFVLETTDFAMAGRVFTNSIPGRVTVDRASYTETLTTRKLDVFATAFPTTLGRLPGSQPSPQVTPILSYFDTACGVGPNGTLTAPTPTNPPTFAEVQMFAAGKNYWAQNQPAVIPASVCVEDYTARDATGSVVPAFYQANVTDEISITQALYDPSNGGSLTVMATSSDEVAPPILTLAGFGDLAAGTITVSQLAAPPAKIQVISAVGGLNEFQVTTGIATTASVTIPVAVNDDVTTQEDVPLLINVLANDTLGGVPIPTGAAAVTITQPPRIGSVVVNPDGSLLYTPNLNVNGAEGIAYKVTVAGVQSNEAYITIIINPVNDPPVAVNDAITAVRNIANSINLLANDTDPDGAADLTKTVIVAWPTQLGPRPTPTSGTVTFTPTTNGTYTFTYQAQDTAGTLSTNTASVTVTVIGTEAIQNVVATFRTTKGRWIVSGTDTVRAGQTLTITLDNGSASGTVIGTAVVDATGAWLLDYIGATGVLDPRTSGASRIRVRSSLSTATATATINVRL